MTVTIGVLIALGIIAAAMLVKKMYIASIIVVVATGVIAVICRYRERFKLRPPIVRTEYSKAADLGTFPPPGRTIGSGRFGEVESDDDDDEADAGGQGDLYHRRMHRQRHTQGKYGPRVVGGSRYRRGLQHPVRIRVQPQTRRYYD
jgi:hypothetical protein